VFGAMSMLEDSCSGPLRRNLVFSMEL